MAARGGQLSIVSPERGQAFRLGNPNLSVAGVCVGNFGTDLFYLAKTGGRSEMSWSVGTGTVYNEGRRYDEEHPALTDHGKYLIYVGRHPHAEKALLAYKSPFIDKITISATKVSVGDGTGASWQIQFAPGFDRRRPSRPKPPTDDQIAEMKRDIEVALLAFPLWPADFGPPALSRLRTTSVQFVE